ncbi:Uncharacterized protein SCF082_LOCUS31568 [Durusdinium trenchii]|uniref:Right handed beta helix domain-containing protein n=3 Tax=Durusdinium trenchii TaxID=1381693 RepID=A0ABP0N8D3_9DINO
MSVLLVLLIPLARVLGERLPTWRPDSSAPSFPVRDSSLLSLPDNYTRRNPRPANLNEILEIRSGITDVATRTFRGVEKIRAHNGTLYLSGGLTFDVPYLEIEGNLMIVAVATGFTCITVKGVLIINGNLSISDCEGPDGGAINANEFNMTQGILTIQNSSTVAGHWRDFTSGGAIQADHFQQTGGQIVIQHCRAHGPGGAIWADEFSFKGGSLQIENCEAIINGQGHRYWVGGHRYQGGGGDDIDFSDVETEIGAAVAARGGGAIAARRFDVFGGTLILKHCSVRGVDHPGEGGAISAWKVDISEGVLLIQHCRAEALKGGGFGGAIAAGKYMQSGGNVTITASSARGSGFHPGYGGAIHAEQAGVFGGNLMINDCRAESLKASHGGGIYVVELYRQIEGNVTIENCSAEGDGGGLFSSEDMMQHSGRLQIRQCHALGEGGKGGGIYAERIYQNNAELQVKECTGDLGGAMFMDEWKQTERSTAIFQDCVASRDGGAVFSRGDLNLSGKIVFKGCRAEGSGGGIRVQSARLNVTSAVTFDECTAGQSGGALYTNGSAEFHGGALFRSCFGGTSATVAVVGKLVSSHIEIVGTETFKQLRQEVKSIGDVTITAMSCNKMSECQLEAPQVSVRDLSCPWGAGRGERSSTRSSIVGCFECPAGTTRLVDAVNALCEQCPEKAEWCLSTGLKMPLGMTVDWWNLSSSTYCPNPSACPGGEIKSLPGVDHSKRSQMVFSSMCRTGYKDDGCWKCSEKYGTADGNPLSCAPCSDSVFGLIRALTYYVVKDTWLFFSAVASALTATGQKKQSSVLINQLMAFATVSSIVVSAVMQTDTFKQLHYNLQWFLQSSDLVVGFAQGGGSGSSISTDCLLRQFGLSPGLMTIHMASSIIPLILMLILAVVKEPLISVVVGTNVFLPGFTSLFGNYLIAFRLKPFDEGGDLLMPFMPGFALDWLVISAAILVCFAVGTGSWYRVALSKSDEVEMPRHVLYLTQPYRPQCRAWEIERLARKMLLSLLTATIPVTFSGALQMQVVSAILIISLTLHYRWSPYKDCK